MKHRTGISKRRTILRAAVALSGIASFPGILRAADTIKIGFLGPLSGALAVVGQTNLNCLMLAVDEINSTGGLGGRKLEVVVEDSQMSTKVALEKARKLFGKDRVEAITGMVIPSEREPVLSAAIAEGKMALHPNFDEGRCHANLLTTGLATNQSAVPTMGWLVKNVGKTLYALVSDTGTNRALLIPQLTAALERDGGRLTGVQYFPFGTRDFGPALQQVRAANPATVWHAISDDPITLVKQYKSFDMKPQLVSSIMHETIAASTAGDAVGSLSVECYFMSIDTPANKRFLDSYTARYKDFGRQLFVRGRAVVQPHGERTYVAAKVWAEAVRIAGSTDLAKLLAALGKVEIEAPRGNVRVDTASGRLVIDTLLGRVQADNGIDTVTKLGRIPAKCTSQ
jgi:ABC-type branched-subunit amino acid transport system substrate-binding protein